MRLVCLTQWFYPEPATGRGLPFAQWMQERGHEVIVLTTFPNYPAGTIYPGYKQRTRHWEEREGVRILRVPVYPDHSRSAARRVLNYFSFAASSTFLGLPAIGKVDAVYVTSTPPTAGLGPWLRSRFGRTPYLFNVCDVWPEAVLESGLVRRPLVAKAMKAVIDRICAAVYGGATYVTTITEGYRRIVVERGVPEERVHTVYNWVDEGMFQPVARDAALARALGFEGKVNFLYAGNLGPYQDVATIIRAAALLQDLPDLQVVLMGAGLLEPELRTLVAEKNLKNVLFAGFREPGFMTKVYPLADALLIHLRDAPFLRATLPSKTQVSLAVGRPVIMATCGESAETVARAQAGLVCPPENPEALADAMRKMYATAPEERDAMGARGRRFYLDTMSLAVGATKIEALLMRTVSGSSPHPGP